MTRHAPGLAIAGAGVVAACVVGGLWFRSGTFYARRDTGPFVRTSLAHELTSLWSHQETGAGGPTYHIVRMVEIVLLRVAHVLGGGDALAQRLLFAAIFAFAATGGAAFASRLTSRAWPAFLAGVIVAFNPLVMVTLPNFLIPACIGAAGWFAALTLDAATAHRRARPRLVALISLGAAYVAANPPLLGVLLLWLCALPLLAAALTGTGRRGARRALGLLGRSACWAVPLALWWAVPYVLALRSASTAGTINATTDVYEWSWTHANGSLDRVLALVANWSWPSTRLSFNASAMGSPRLLWLSFVLPMGLVAAPLLARPARRRPALWLLLLAVVVAWISKGLVAPLAGVNAMLYERVPGMFLLREPSTKTGALLALAIVLCWALALDGLAARASARRRVARQGATRMLVMLGALAAVPLLFAAPMLTGAIVEPGERVAVPHAWREVAEVVNDSPLPGRAFVLPLDDFYQVATTWGFYGNDSLPSQLLTRPTVRSNPQAYIGEPPGYQQLVQAAERALVDRDPLPAIGAFRALGVSHVIVRKDIDYATPMRAVRMARPDAIEAGLALIAGLRPVRRTGVADVFEFEAGTPAVEAYSGTIRAARARGDALAPLAAMAPIGTALVTSGGIPASLDRGSAWYLDVNAPASITPPRAGEWFYQRRATEAPLLELVPTSSGVVLRDAVHLVVGGQPLAARPETVLDTGGRPLVIDVDGTLVDLSDGRGFARIRRGAVMTAYTGLTGARLASWSAVGDCHAYDRLRPSDVLRADLVTGDDGPAVRLRANRHSACVSATAPAVGPGDVIRVSYEQRAVRGAPPRTCLWQQGANTCAPLRWSAERRGSWFAREALYRVPDGAGLLALYLYADEPAAGGPADTEVWYRDVTLQGFAAGAVTQADPADPPTGGIRLGGGRVPVAAGFDVAPPVLGDRSPVGDCGRTDDRGIAELGLRATPLDPRDTTAVRLHASHHSACVSMPVFGLRPGVSYDLSFESLVRHGSPPRVCLLDEAANRCAQLVALEAPEGGTGRFRSRVRLEHDASSTRLYLYADARSRATTVEYRNIRVAAVADEALVLQPPAVQTSALPEIVAEPHGTERFRVEVRDATAPFILALTEAFDAGWRIRGLPPGARAEHVELDGYRNGWAIDARGDMDLTIEYAPARTARLAMRVSQLTAFALVGSFIWPVAATRVRGRRDRRARRAFLAAQLGSRRVPLPEAMRGARALMSATR